jgi:beta-1,4-N-acetylglucosaminyltransferase
MPAERCVVSVGSTSFNELVHAACSHECALALEQRGIHELVLQVGQTSAQPALPKHSNLSLYVLTFVDDFQQLLRSASLVVCHAGAGCSLEAVRNKRPAILVPNETLMHNHQLELAQELDRLGHAKMARLDCLATAIEQLDTSSLKLQLPNADPSRLQAVLDEVCFRG